MWHPAIPLVVILLAACTRPERSPSDDLGGGTESPTTGTGGPTNPSTATSLPSDDDATVGGSASEGGSTGAATCTDPAPAMRTEVILPTPTGDLHGTVMTPEGCGPFPTVLFHVGSGPTDRDGNTLGLPGRNDGHLQLAEALLQEGFASVRFDKRGIGASQDAVDAGEDIVIETYAADLALWVQALREQPDAVADIVLVGHSEGALISTIAAHRVPIEALILLAAPGRRTSDVMRTQLANNLEDPELLAQANAIIAELEQGNTVADVPEDLRAIFDPSIQPFLISLFAHDPAAELARLSVPTTIIVGTEDIQVPVSEGEVLAAARPDARLRIIENMTHPLKDAAMGQDAAYTDPDVPLAAGLVEALIDAAAP